MYDAAGVTDEYFLDLLPLQLLCDALSMKGEEQHAKILALLLFCDVASENHLADILVLLLLCAALSL